MSSTRVDFTRLRWRFVVCAAAFYVNVIAWGFISSTGMFEDALRTTFRLSSFRSTLPGSIQIGTMSVLSLFASILTIKFGVRRITIAGACIATLGSVLAAVIGEYWAFCAFYGLVVGAGETLMLVPAVLAIPPYFHPSRVSLATASAVSGASVGMLAVPFLLQHLLDRYGLRGATLLGSCLWLSVGLAGALFGRGATTIVEEENKIERVDDEREYIPITPRRSYLSGNRMMYTRRTSLLPMSTHYQLQPPQVASNDPESSSVHSLPLVVTPQTPQPSTQLAVPPMDLLSPSPSECAPPPLGKHTTSTEYFLRTMLSEIRSLLEITRFRLLLVSIVFVWSFDETNFLFLTDLLKSSGQAEQRSTLLIAIIGLSDLVGQLFFGYLGDIECLDPLILWMCTSIIAGGLLTVVPVVGPSGLIGLCVLYGLHTFFLAAPNALGNVIMIDVVGMPRYAIAYGFSLLVSGSTSLFGYPLLGLLKDRTRRWTIPFALVGSVMICGGLVAGSMPFYRCYKTRRRKTSAASRRR